MASSAIIASPAPHDPANRDRAVPLTYEQSVRG
jgi:hypothetical protein